MGKLEENENPEGTRKSGGKLAILVLTNHLISQFKVRIELERWFSNQIGKLEPKDCDILENPDRFVYSIHCLKRQ